MANIFDNIYQNFARTVASYVNDAMGARYGILGNYTTGDHRPQMKRREGQPDDNIIRNFTGLAIYRSISRMFRGGIKFVLPSGNTKQQEYIDKVWDLNKKEILLYQLGLHASGFGTGYIEICPEKLNDPITQKADYYPRLVPLYPPLVRIVTNPQDIEDVWQYRIEYTTMTDGREMAYRKTVRRASEAEGIEQAGGEMSSDYWLITVEVKHGVAQWEEVERVTWLYDFPPIVHFKNLPSLNIVYGYSDIEDAINIQDKSNFVVSNMAKIVKYYASPQTIGTGFSMKSLEKMEGAVGTFHSVSNPDARVYNLEMDSDLASSMALSDELRQSVFDVVREIDLSNVADKLGALTNFAMRVLYTDAIDKNDTKRQLYGDALKEVNRRVLVLAGYAAEASEPGTIQWGEALAINIMEELQADRMALDMRIVDRETVYKRYEQRYGVSWEDVEKRLEEERNERKEKTDTSGMDNEGMAGRGGQGGEYGRSDSADTQGRQFPPTE